MNRYRDVIGFLKRNGFSKTKTNSYTNNFCNVRFLKGRDEYEYSDYDEGCYAVTNNNEETIYSPNLNIYWLIGYLTWQEYIPKDYNK